jgi:hypothetical protein
LLAHMRGPGPHCRGCYAVHPSRCPVSECG